MGAGALGKQCRGRRCGLRCFLGGCAGVKRRNPPAFLSPAACLEAGLATGLWVGGRQRGGPGRPMEPSGLADGTVTPCGPWAALGAGSRPADRPPLAPSDTAAGAVSLSPWPLAHLRAGNHADVQGRSENRGHAGICRVVAD